MNVGPSTSLVAMSWSSHNNLKIGTARAEILGANQLEAY